MIYGNGIKGPYQGSLLKSLEALEGTGVLLGLKLHSLEAETAWFKLSDTPGLPQHDPLGAKGALLKGISVESHPKP